MEAHKLVSYNSCGTKLREGAKFCHGCGQKVVSPAVSTPIPSTSEVCPTCGVNLRRGAKFCAKCGTSIKKTVSAPVAAPVKTTSVTSSKITAEKIPKKTLDVCVNCGSVLRGSSKYCANCGTDNSEISPSDGLEIAFTKGSEAEESTTGDVLQTEHSTETVKDDTDDLSVLTPPLDGSAASKCFEGLEEIRYYVKELETDASKLTAVSSLYSGPLGLINWKFSSSGIELTTTGKTRIQRSFSMEITLDEPVNYQYSKPFAGITVECSDEIAKTAIERESRIAEKISSLIPPLTIKAVVNPGQVDIKITASLEKKNIKSLFNLAKDLGWFFDITIR